ncbi:arsenate reductase/protein-tyrosine-phosphatase family protein [Methylocaldum gracile]|jgi:protein-tyrosine-phosphatase|uniref:arsenate reductase/protein-tyrosine-phosphatase family protein n=1 Tax=Methylocaldum sp. 0917 TaxID=2485163 RepID=UPI00105D4953
MKDSYRVLVLDADFVSCLPIVRSLGRRGIVCDIASPHSAPIARYSRYANKHWQYPDPLTQGAAFVDYLAEHLSKVSYSLVIPVTERTLVPLARSPKMAPFADLLAIAPRNSLNKVLDKAETMALARQCDVPTPFSYPIARAEELSEFVGELEYPVVLKPAHSISGGDDRRPLNVAYAHDDGELFKLARSMLDHGPFLLQQYARGVGAGIELLANHGEIVYAFQHERLHELPLTGGGSCYRKSVAVNPVLLAASRRLIKALDWHGVAMVEFKWNPATGEYWLMEINGRFWGSLPLACAAGADFPVKLFDLLVLNQLPTDSNYREHVYCRKLSADVYWYEQVLRRSGDPKLVAYPRARQLLLDALFILHPTRHFFDVQQWRDPLPGLMDFVELLNGYLQRIRGIVGDKYLLKRHGSTGMRTALTRKLGQAKTVLFVCYGNINRSALAQVLAENGVNPSKIRFDSAGFHPEDNRPADPNMIKVARSHGFDMTGCRSKRLDKLKVDSADIIFVMEGQQYRRLVSEHPEAKDRTFLLGSLTKQQFSDIDIADPYNQAMSEYENCFNRIQHAVDELSRIIGQNKLTASI